MTLSTLPLPRNDQTAYWYGLCRWQKPVAAEDLHPKDLQMLARLSELEDGWLATSGPRAGDVTITDHFFHYSHGCDISGSRSNPDMRHYPMWGARADVMVGFDNLIEGTGRIVVARQVITRRVRFVNRKFFTDPAAAVAEFYAACTQMREAKVARYKHHCQLTERKLRGEVVSRAERRVRERRAREIARLQEQELRRIHRAADDAGSFDVADELRARGFATVADSYTG